MQSWRHATNTFKNMSGRWSKDFYRMFVHELDIVYLARIKLSLLQIYSRALCATGVQIYCLPLTKICNTMLDAPVNAI
jgi:hypothetical protein